jgi:hypothetical protein
VLEFRVLREDKVGAVIFPRMLESSFFEGQYSTIQRLIGNDLKVLMRNACPGIEAAIEIQHAIEGLACCQSYPKVILVQRV